MKNVPPLVSLNVGVLPVFAISRPFAMTKSITMLPFASLSGAPQAVAFTLKSPAINIWSVGPEMWLTVVSSDWSSREKRCKEKLGLK